MGRCSMGGGASRLHSSSSRSLVRSLKALSAFVMVWCGGSEGASGRRSALARGAKDRVPSIGRARLASSSKGRWDQTFECGRLVFHLRGNTLGGCGCRVPYASLGPYTCVGRGRSGRVGQLQG